MSARKNRPGVITGAAQSISAGGLRLDISIPRPTDSTQQVRRRGGAQ